MMHTHGAESVHSLHCSATLARPFMNRLFRPVFAVTLVLLLGACTGPGDGDADVAADAAGSGDSGADDVGAEDSETPDDTYTPPTDAFGTDTGGDFDAPGIDTEPELLEYPDVEPDVPVEVGEPPVVTTVWPSSGTSDGGDLIIVNGRNFTWDLDVRIGGVPVSYVDVVDEFEFWMRTEPMPPGTYDMKVSNRGGTGQLDDAFTYVAPLEVHVVEPSEGVVDGRFYVTVRGQGFGPDTRFLFGEREALEVDVINDARAEVQVPPAETPGAIDVIAFDTRFARLDDGFSYSRRPSLNQLLPPIGSALGGDVVRIDGYGINESCTLLIDGVETEVFRGDDGWLAAETPGGTPGTVYASVDCGERGADFLADAYTYVSDDESAIYGVWPAIGFASGGEVVTVYGTGLANATEVRFGTTEGEIVDNGE